VEVLWIAEAIVARVHALLRLRVELGLGWGRSLCPVNVQVPKENEPHKTNKEVRYNGKSFLKMFERSKRKAN
jgi:hypothetical protein